MDSGRGGRLGAAGAYRKGIAPEQWQLVVDVLMLGVAIAAVVHRARPPPTTRSRARCGWPPCR